MQYYFYYLINFKSKNLLVFEGIEHLKIEISKIN